MRVSELMKKLSMALMEALTDKEAEVILIDSEGTEFTLSIQDIVCNDSTNTIQICLAAEESLDDYQE